MIYYCQLILMSIAYWQGFILQRILKNTVIDAGNKRFNAFTLYYISAL